MLQKMVSKSIFLLGIFLVLATKVYSYDEDLKIVVNYVNPTAPPSPIVTPPSPVKAPPTPPLVKSPPIVKAPSPPLVKTPPYQSPPAPSPPLVKPTPPIVKSPPSPPLVKTPPYQSPPIVKAPPTPPPIVKTPPYQSPPIVKPPVAPSPPPTPIVKSWKDCIPLCGYRCQKHSRQNTCIRACMTCCDRCKCVPPGTYGNREKCGKCYTDMVTHGNRPKCP
ncbi:putative gibberellin regulated protein [Medicago truncatula]|uniref:Putative gibberellin regulated protein n=1 Tax=Medicago truncatula TaxID=3880 RepID=A0A396HBH2_MEDTR|nr:putative gibberellin regulated protein [Medicago truncatula]